MRIGYSFWGFLGAGITDTPDGGRSHRRTLVDGMRALGHDVVFLQSDRDLAEAGEDLRGVYRWHRGLPEIDALFLEWRWPIPGRNTTPCRTAGHSCDLHRQDQLLDHYTRGAGTPTIVWDKDRQLPPGDRLHALPHVTVCEAALRPTAGARTLLFPVADAALESADPVKLAALPRDLDLVYVGNQYGRDEQFGAYFAPAAARRPHLVAGKWPRTDSWPQVRFTGRIPFRGVEALHRRALATVLLLPTRYAVVGQFTQRTFEAVLAGCLPLAPATIDGAAQVVPRELHVRDGDDVASFLPELRRLAGTPAHADLIRRCLDRIGVFRLSRQLSALSTILTGEAATVAPVRSQP